MHVVPTPVLLFLFAVFPIAALPAAESLPEEPASWFHDNPPWSRAEAIALPAGAARFEIRGPGRGTQMYLCGETAAAPQLRTLAYIGDCVVRITFLLTPDARAGLYLEGRYKLELTPESMGRLAEPEAPPPGEGAAAAVPPLVNAAGPLGAWQTLEAKFRAPRLDDARNKIQDALILEVKINGKIVQSNTVPGGRSAGTEFGWDDAGGPATIAVERGCLAIREFSIRRADFEAVRVPVKSGEPTNTAALVDFVRQGEELFRAIGCAECHAVKRDDPAEKTGPDLYGLFRREPRDRVIVASEGHRFTIKADRAYLHRSIRKPHAEVAVAEGGPNRSEPYPPVMPPYDATILSDPQIDALDSYLATLNDPPNQGPVIRLVEPTGPKNYDPLADPMQLLVGQMLRIQRGPMENLSGRAVHVGQPNGINYSFDPRVLAVAKIWQGGFINTSGEYINRGGLGLRPGFESRELDLGPSAVLFAPLDNHGRPVDFSFKDAGFAEEEKIREAVTSSRDHLARLAEADAQFLGYSRDSRSATAYPSFHYRVGRNRVSVGTRFADNGQVEIGVDGELADSQTFLVNEEVLGPVTVSAGELSDGKWTLPAGKCRGAWARGRLALAENSWRPPLSDFMHGKQPLVIEASHSKLPDGYRAETYVGPKDNYGREQLFEPLGLAVAPDGTVVVATRTAGIWRLSEGEWHLFAEGLFDCLGIEVEDEKGLRLVAGQKAELTRITDTDGDGRADTFETMTDAFSYNGNYHAYLHGPVRDRHGDYFITLNLDDAGRIPYEYRGGGQYMGTSGGYRGWAIRVPAQGGFEPWAAGLRSPASLGLAPDGRLWYADNQGEFFGTSKLFVLKRGAFYGHPAGLVDRPGMSPDSPAIAWDQVKAEREPAVLLFPQSRLANSPGNPAWDTTDGRFGPFAGQMFIGDQTQSNLLRVTTEIVGTHEQGVAIPFATELQSGVMRPLFLPDRSLLLGQTGRGWQAKGGRVASLQRITWDGKTIFPAIHHVSAIPGGFEIGFTVAIPAHFDDAAVRATLAMKSWAYRDAPDYGSPELDERAEPITRIEICPDRTTLRVFLATTEQPKIHPEQTARVYHLTVAGQDLWGASNPGFDAFYTLYEFPAAP